MKVSVIIPTYNRQQYIEQAINSFLEQDYTAKELIIVNDGSKDNTQNIIEKYRQDNIVILNERNGGQAKAQNIGINHATGDLICTLDDDDLFYDNMSLSKRVEYFITHSDIEWIYTSAVDINEHGKEVAKHPCEQLSWHMIFNRDRIFINSLMWRKSIHAKTGYFDEQLSSNEDWDWKIRLSIHCRYKAVDIYTVKHRIHPAMRSNIHRGSGELLTNECKLKDKIKFQYGGLFNE